MSDIVGGGDGAIDDVNGGRRLERIHLGSVTGEMTDVGTGCSIFFN